ncbi:MAG: DUF937 domain-containing protein [Acidobacteria bacterium]|nr:DUF937 domain-containing protein [Acidobacteriota bacterium]
MWVEMLMNAGGQPAVGQIGQRFGMDQNQTMSVVQALLPALGAGIQRNVSNEGGIESLLGALSGGNHGQYLDQPELMLREETTADGNGILGHLFGSKDVSRQVAASASAQTGVGSDVIKQMLPLVASMVMGGLAKQSSASNLHASAAPAQGLMGMLTPLLDSNRDGSAVDDVIGMIGRFMTNR